MNHRSRPQGLALIALAALSTHTPMAAAANPTAVKFDAGDAELPKPNGTKKQVQRPTAKKEGYIGDPGPFTCDDTLRATIDLASKMPAYVEPAAAKKATANAHHRRDSTSQFGGLGVKNHHHREVGVLDLVAAGAKQHGYTATLRS